MTPIIKTTLQKIKSHLDYIILGVLIVIALAAYIFWKTDPESINITPPLIKQIEQSAQHINQYCRIHPEQCAKCQKDAKSCNF